MTRVVYVSPLKALSNDIQRNLEQPLAGIGAQLTRLGMPVCEIRAQVRTGDTSQTERAAMRRLAPHILVTTPSRCTCCSPASLVAGCSRPRAR